ncbi:MAG: amidohydrolase [Gaiellaceae bacterium]
MILDNGIIRTLDPSLPRAGALAIAGDRVVGGVGAHETALATPERVDLAGRCVLPGFCDAHVHFPSWAMALREVRLDGCRSLEEAVALVAGAAARTPPGAWVRGRGWRSGDWVPATEPTRQALDPIGGDTPVLLESRDGHSLWLNSAALAHAHGDLETPGGIVEETARHEPTGVLREQAAWRFRERFGLPDQEEQLSAMRGALRTANARGVTAVHDMDGAFAPPLWQRLRDEEALTLRVWQSLPHDRLDALRQIGISSGLGDDLLRIGFLKVFMDGTLGSRTAWMLDGSGVAITTGEELEEIVLEAAGAGFPVSVHAIGDAANHAALDAFAATRAEWQPRGLRQRIEHAQLVSRDDLPRFAELGVCASVQFGHAPADRDLAERDWPHLLEGAYAYRSLFESGALVANGSDAPIEDLDPLAGLRAGVLRTLDERPGWRAEQSVSIDQALQASAVNGAWLSGDERRRGKLIPGYLADLVVLDRDPLGCPPEELAELRVVATMIGGRWVHNPPPWD